MKPEWVDPFDILLHEQECGGCKYFDQHYTQAETGEYFSTLVGECTLCPPKQGNIRTNTSISCEKFVLRIDPDSRGLLEHLPGSLAAAIANARPSTKKTPTHTRTLTWTRKRFNKGLLRVRLAHSYELSGPEQQEPSLNTIRAIERLFF